ncbi:Oidioi.mRNA.OKI2018_I69.chr2.g7905.t1.cds [Oikopleura dioica]|uniref:Oidioi.mRNA.OKI2018_I69.chr2.g7905.t1.cds n=1 Tax=Oikopleura dioica TaxID=34765 RepID=A0ABN7TCD6_OIKDI|nr:Oidioi.mRNA.OKI2018_I69.chr2.g7905.t1.cds [Oikopleura dioica]
MIENSVGVVKFDLLVKETGEYHCVITIEVHSDFTAEYSSALGVSESATKEEIDEAFQKEKESFKRKQQAYDFLKETAKPVEKVRSEDEDSGEQFSAAVDPVVSSDQEFSGDSWCELSDYECETEFFDPSFTLKCHLKEDLTKIENDLKKVENELKSKLPTNYFHGMNDGEIQTCLQLLKFDDREMTLQFWSDREHEVSEGKWKVKYLGCQNFADFQTADGSFYLWIEHSDYSPKFKAVATEHHFFRNKNVNRKVLRSTGDGNRQFVKYKREFDPTEDTESSGSLTDSTVRDYSAVLGVPIDASKKEIKNAIRKEETDFKLKQEAYVYLKGCAVSEGSPKEDSVGLEDPFVALKCYLRKNCHNDYAKKALQLLALGEKKLSPSEYSLSDYSEDVIFATGWKLAHCWYEDDDYENNHGGCYLKIEDLRIENSVGAFKFDAVLEEEGEYECLVPVQVHSDFTTEYSSVLGISEKAMNREIDEAFRKEKENFKQTQEAYDFLKETAMPEKNVSSEDEHSDEFTIIDEADPEESDYECEPEIFDPCSILKCYLNDEKEIEERKLMLETKEPILMKDEVKPTIFKLTNYLHGMNDDEIQATLQQQASDNKEMTLQERKILLKKYCDWQS